MRIDYNPDGRWSAAVVRTRYRELRGRMGGVAGFEPEPRTDTDGRGMTRAYGIMDSVVDGVQLGDSACVELSVEYIEAAVMTSGSGYLRERMARSLRHADINVAQQRRPAEVSLAQLQHGRMRKEFKEYIRLFRALGIAPDRRRIERCERSPKAYIRRAARRLLS